MKTNIMDIKIRAALDGHQFDVLVADKDNGSEFIFGFGVITNAVLTTEYDNEGNEVDNGCMPWLEAIKKIEAYCNDETFYEVTMSIPEACIGGMHA